MTTAVQITLFVDGERIKADVFYKLYGGEFVEVK